MRRTRRSFSDQFKAQIVLELLTGEASQAELCRKHNLQAQLLGRWKTTALERLHTLFQEDAQVSAEQGHVAELEQLVGRASPSRELKSRAPDGASESLK